MTQDDAQTWWGGLTDEDREEWSEMTGAATPQEAWEALLQMREAWGCGLARGLCIHELKRGDPTPTYEASVGRDTDDAAKAEGG